MSSMLRQNLSVSGCQQNFRLSFADASFSSPSRKSFANEPSENVLLIYCSFLTVNQKEDLDPQAHHFSLKTPLSSIIIYFSYFSFNLEFFSFL